MTQNIPNWEKRNKQTKNKQPNQTKKQQTNNPLRKPCLYSFRMSNV